MSDEKNQVYSDEETQNLETQEWLESLDYVIEHGGSERVGQLLSELQKRVYSAGIRMPFTANTPYINSIPASLSGQPGNRATH